MVAEDQQSVEQVPGRPPPADDADQATQTVFIRHADMRRYLDDGLMTPLSRLMLDHVQYDDQWWIADRTGWRLITGSVLTRYLDWQHRWVEGNLYPTDSSQTIPSHAGRFKRGDVGDVPG